MRRLLFALSSTLLFVVAAASCGAPKKCNPQSCSTGCCTPNDECLPGGENSGCGISGNACVDCTLNAQVCGQQVCVANNTGGGDAGTGTGDAGFAAGSLEQLAVYLRGDFDNAAQVAASGIKLVERHVCPLPGRPQTAELAWLYVEHVEDLSSGQRDAYFTRVTQLASIDGGIRSRAYKFAAGHPLATNAFAYNGPRDGCWQRALLQSITDADLVYRTGCDVDFQSDGDGGFNASTSGTACTFPGGYIQTRASVFPNGLDSQDTAFSGGTQTGDLFQFRRVLGWMPPDAG